MSSLTPNNKYKLYNSINHPMRYPIYCSSTTLTIQINNDFVICPKEGGNILVIGYDGYIHCHDYNLIVQEHKFVMIYLIVSRKNL